jgi:hypothetical protein
MPRLSRKMFPQRSSLSSLLPILFFMQGCTPLENCHVLPHGFDNDAVFWDRRFSRTDLKRIITKHVTNVIESTSPEVTSHSVPLL